MHGPRAEEFARFRGGHYTRPKPVSPIVRELSLMYALVTVVTVIVTYTPGPFMRDFGHLVLASAFLFGALGLARRHGGARRFGIDLAGVLEAEPDEHGEPRGLLEAMRRALPRFFSELGVALLAALVIFPPFVPAFVFWHDVQHPFTLHLPDAPFDLVLHQLVVVALPEEALFRGYFQTRLEELFPARFSLLGRPISPLALVLQAALFALLHYFVGFAPVRLAVFFPGLVFGLLRSLRGGIGAAIWFHAFSNLLSEILTRGYL